MNEWISIGLVVLSTVCAALGQLWLKFGSLTLKRNFNSLIRNYALMTGFCFYVMSSIIFIIALKGHELTVLYPLSSLNYVWVSLLSMKYLNEKMNKYKWVGILFIIAGVSLVCL